MSRKDISILVINKTFFEDEKCPFGLKNYIETLRAYGYRVTETQTSRNFAPNYNMIIAHPLWAEISDLYNFHKEHLEIPIVFYSGLAQGYSNRKTKKSRVSGFLTDSDGAYYSFGSSMQEFLKLIKHLSSEIHRRGS